MVRLTGLLMILTMTLGAASLTIRDTSYWSAQGGAGGTKAFQSKPPSPLVIVDISTYLSATYGQATASAHAWSGSTVPGYLTHVEASGLAGFTDAVTLFTGTSSGYVVFNLEMPGALTPDYTVWASGTFTAGTSSINKAGQNGGAIYRTLSTPFTSGVPVQFSATAEAWAWDNDPNNFYSMTAGGSDAIQVKMGNVEAFDMSGNQISGYSYTTESNHNYYNFVGGTEVPTGAAVGDPVTVPEPGSLGLIAIGLLASTLCRAGRKWVNGLVGL